MSRSLITLLLATGSLAVVIGLYVISNSPQAADDTPAPTPETPPIVDTIDQPPTVTPRVEAQPTADTPAPVEANASVTAVDTLTARDYPTQPEPVIGSTDPESAFFLKAELNPYNAAPEQHPPLPLLPQGPRADPLQPAGEDRRLRARRDRSLLLLPLRRPLDRNQRPADRADPPALEGPLRPQSRNQQRRRRDGAGDRVEGCGRRGDARCPLAPHDHPRARSLRPATRSIHREPHRHPADRLLLPVRPRRHGLRAQLPRRQAHRELRLHPRRRHDRPRLHPLRDRQAPQGHRRRQREDRPLERR